LDDGPQLPTLRIESDRAAGPVREPHQRHGRR
jgi:hypothetical protein